MADSLEHKAAVITGAGRGFGRAFALALASAGCRVPAPALALHVDVTQRSSVDHVMSEVVREWGGPDILVNDAGVFPRSTVLDMNEAMWDQVLAVNLKGTFLCSQTAARIMVPQQRGGRIVNLVSRAAK